MYNIFLTNKYTIWYNLIITSAQNKARRKLKKTNILYEYFERHHIIPKSMGGSNDQANLVLLTPKEHYVCHLLLTKICVSTNHKIKMLYAFNRIVNKSPIKITNSSMYNRIRTEFAIMKSNTSKGELNNFYGKSHTESTRSYLSTICPRYGPDNGFYGKTHSPEVKQHLSTIAKQRVNIPPPPQKGANNHFAKYYKITTPDGKEFTIKCLRTFVKENNLCWYTIKIYKNKGIIPTLVFDRPYRVKNMEQKQNCQGYSIELTNEPFGILPSIDHTVI